jgi:nitrate/nitrite transporter NarK
MDIFKLQRAGHLPTLFCSFLYFTTSCMAWMMVGALANWIIPDLGGSPPRGRG